MTYWIEEIKPDLVLDMVGECIHLYSDCIVMFKCWVGGAELMEIKLSRDLY